MFLLVKLFLLCGTIRVDFLYSLNTVVLLRPFR